MSASDNSKNKPESGSDEPTQKGTTHFQLLLRILMVVVGAIVLLGVIGWFLPSKYEVTTSIEIDAPAEEIYGMIVRTDLWPTWSPSWDFSKQEKVVYFYNVDFSGVTWSHEDMVGAKHIGKMWLGNKWPNERIEYYVERNYKVFNYFEFEELDGGTRTKVSWSTEADLPRKKWTDGLFYGWAGLIFSAGLKGQYDADLIRLKEVCETNLVDDQKGDGPDTSQQPF